MINITLYKTRREILSDRITLVSRASRNDVLQGYVEGSNRELITSSRLSFKYSLGPIVFKIKKRLKVYNLGYVILSGGGAGGGDPLLPGNF